MFELELHQLPAVYTAVFLGGILFAYWVHNLRRTRHERHALRDVVRCRICAFQFRAEETVEYPQCPRCSSAVERSPISRI